MMKFQNNIVTVALFTFLFTLTAASTISSGRRDSEGVSRRGRDKRAGAQGEPNQHSNKKSPFAKIHNYAYNDDSLPRRDIMPPNPNPYRIKYEDGTTSPLLRLKIRGDETDPSHQVYEETLDGFTVEPAKGKGKYVYVEVDDDTGDYIETDLVVGVDDPVSAHLKKDAATTSRNKKASLSSPAAHHVKSIFESDDFSRKLRGGSMREDEKSHRRTVITSGTLKNLVVPIKFADHTSRSLPSRSDLNVLMNNAGPNPSCPTGSVRDVYLDNSFGALDLQSTVIDWITIDFTEKYCADGDSGTALFHTCLTNALDKAVAAGIDFGDYDLDNDGLIDGMTFFHSGYAAEWGGTDAYGANYLDRIWSHQWSIFTTNWTHNGVRVYDYHVNPSIWGTSGTTIGRIGKS